MPHFGVNRDLNGGTRTKRHSPAERTSALHFVVLRASRGVRATDFEHPFPSTTPSAKGSTPASPDHAQVWWGSPSPTRLAQAPSSNSQWNSQWLPR